MRVAVIGTGNMATGLGRRFAAAGHEVVVGPLWSAFNVEKVAAVMVTIAYVIGTGTDQALKLISR